jgi:cytochrome b
MAKIRVYDIPIRIFHWLLVCLFLFSFVVAKTFDDEQLIFSYHMLSGLLLSFALGYRIAWGLVGGHFSRFRHFQFSLSSLINYFKTVTDKNAVKYLGHNPASSWMTVAVFVCVIGLVSTGYMMTTGLKEDFEDIHEIFAIAFLVLGIAHILGMLVYWFFKKDFIFSSMIDGKKTTVNIDQKIPSDLMAGQKPHWVSAVVFVLYVFSAAQFLKNNFDPNTRILNLFGTQLTLGEGEAENEGQEAQGDHSDKDSDSSDED